MPTGSNHQKPYPPEFRREAVALYRRSGRPLKEIAHDLGVSSESLRLWVKQSAIDTDRTAHSADAHQSAAFTTSRGRTPRRGASGRR